MGSESSAKTGTDDIDSHREESGEALSRRAIDGGSSTNVEKLPVVGAECCSTTRIFLNASDLLRRRPRLTWADVDASRSVCTVNYRR
jgi:hypothetical protein